MKSIAVLTSGGDAPGMNAAIRAVVRTAIYYEMQIFGIKYGYKGLIDDDIFEMQSQDVANIIQLGGTVLKTARSDEFLSKEGRKLAYDNLLKHGIEGLVVIGGDGSFKGACTFIEEHSFPIIGIPGTIDKDIEGTDFTIGFDTAVNTAMEAIDKIRDTADAHDRLFIIEVMGRDSGYIAINSGIATGAEDILVPERITNVERVIKLIDFDKRRKKNVHIIIVAEGDDFGVNDLTQIIKNKFPDMEIRQSVLGHIQRGGSPTYYDRVQASKLGYAAVKALQNNQSAQMAGILNGKVNMTPLTTAVKSHRQIDPNMLDMVKVLSS